MKTRYTWARTELNSHLTRYTSMDNQDIFIDRDKYDRTTWPKYTIYQAGISPSGHAGIIGTADTLKEAKAKAEGTLAND